MSNKNHRNHTNYNKISTTPANVDQTNVETTPAVVTPPPEPMDGYVTGCSRLNIRKEPSYSGEIVCEVLKGTTLMIDPTKSTDDWFKVYTELGVEGYCMKIYVTIKS